MTEPDQLALVRKQLWHKARNDRNAVIRQRCWILLENLHQLEERNDARMREIILQNVESLEQYLELLRLCETIMQKLPR
jgi:hypothetical protein